METNNLTTKVSNYKLIAREALRMELINPRLTKISILKNNIAEYNECKNKANHNIKVQKYELSKLDQEHPNYDKNKTFKEETLKDLEEQVKHYDEHILDIEKEILEQKEKITKIENGETKVSIDDLNCLVDKMIRQDALNQAK